MEFLWASLHGLPRSLQADGAIATAVAPSSRSYPHPWVRHGGIGHFKDERRATFEDPGRICSRIASSPSHGSMLGARQVEDQN